MAHPVPPNGSGVAATVRRRAAGPESTPCVAATTTSFAPSFSGTGRLRPCVRTTARSSDQDRALWVASCRCRPRMISRRFGPVSGKGHRAKQHRRGLDRRDVQDEATDRAVIIARRCQGGEVGSSRRGPARRRSVPETPPPPVVDVDPALPTLGRSRARLDTFAYYLLCQPGRLTIKPDGGSSSAGTAVATVAPALIVSVLVAIWVLNEVDPGTAGRWKGALICGSSSAVWWRYCCSSS